MFADHDLHWIQFFTDNGLSRWRGTYDYVGDRPHEYPGLPQGHLSSVHWLLRPGSPDEPLAERTTRGIWMVDGDPMLVAARPIVSTGGDEEIHGREDNAVPYSGRSGEEPRGPMRPWRSTTS